MVETESFKPGSLVKARGREWIVLPENRPDLLRLRPLGGSDNDATLLCLSLEPEPPHPATFDPPDPNRPGTQESAILLRDALRLKLRAGAGPFRSFGNLNFEPRAYQLVPLLVALRLDTVRLLIADDVGIGKTIEAGIIARELIDRGEIERLTVICPPHLCDQWQWELSNKFSIDSEVVRTGTARRLEKGLRPNESIFEAHPFTVVSLDFIKSDRRRADFLRACPEFVIVDEAHTCVRANTNTNTRHQRYKLLQGLAEGDPQRNMVFLTATPHSGDDTAFHNLLSLINVRFQELKDLPEGNKRRELREELRSHFIQRRRGDISEWNDDGQFPKRESREATYSLTGNWGVLFEEVHSYARTLVRRAEKGSRLEQRMSWWAALALLRCLSSSPAAAVQALQTRLSATEGNDEKEQIRDLDQSASVNVLDETDDDTLALKESVPAGTVESQIDTQELCSLIDKADALRGPQKDPKLKVCIAQVKSLISDGFRPIVFCRYLATAHYLRKQLVDALPTKTTCVEVITGELVPAQREEKVSDFHNLAKDITPVLVATDCLSEGINLQNHFNAVIHYDLTWNPTRHEQREGRADRFGQSSPTVRTVMLYGKDNPVDEAVIRVILRKAERIRKELGIAVPVPTDNNKVVETIMREVLSHDSSTLPSKELELEVDLAWEKAKEQTTRTVFAQRKLSPGEVMPEWRKAVSVCGGEEDVARFVELASEYLGAPLGWKNGYSRLPLLHLPKPLQDRLSSIGFDESLRISFRQPAPHGTIHIHRAHPLVSYLADHLTELALESKEAGVSRSSAFFTDGVNIRTVLFLLRIRHQIQIVQQGEENGFRSIMAEECLGTALRGTTEVKPLSEADALSLLTMKPSRNMEESQKTHLIKQELNRLPSLESTFNGIAENRAQTLLADHRRIREAGNMKGQRYKVDPVLPVDIMGIFVFMPQARISPQ